MRAAFPRTLPVLAGYLCIGTGFGVLLASKGYSFWWAILMSMTIYAGSMQYVAVDLISGGATLVSTAVMTLLVNARHLFYGISMLEKYRGAGAKKAYMTFGLTDETYSLVSRKQPEGVDQAGYCFLVSAFDQCYWVLGSALGALAGNLPLDFTGIDFALTALFVTIFVEQWLSTKNHLPALVGVGAAVLCLVFFGSDRFLIPTMILIAAILMMLRKTGKEEETNA